jgi:hypothetical protein
MNEYLLRRLIPGFASILLGPKKAQPPYLIAHMRRCIRLLNGAGWETDLP